jgi:3D (Asp-Asp-Asp) domain-containing protein
MLYYLMTEKQGSFKPAECVPEPSLTTPPSLLPNHLTKKTKIGFVLVGFLILVGGVGGYIFFQSTQKEPDYLTLSPDPTQIIPSPSPTPLPPTETPVPTARPTPTIKPASLVSAFVTFYGWSDNGPGGNGIAYPKSRYPQVIHETAAGAGTYNDPVSFAANEQQFAIGERIYLPYLKKYAIKEDLCPGCGDRGGTHVDLWMESNGSYPAELDACEGAFTREGEMIEVNPPKGRPVDVSLLFDPATGRCR